MLAKIPPDVTADFRSVSSQRSHYKATESFYMQVNSTLMIKKNDLDIKRCLGLDKEAKAIEQMFLSDSPKSPKRKKTLPASSFVVHQPENIEPLDFAKSVLVNCGYLKSRKDSAHMLRKGSGYLRMLDSNPSYGPHARETYYGKLLSDDGSMHMLSTTKVGEVSIDENRRVKFRRDSHLNQDSALGFSELATNRLTTERDY